MWYKIFKYLAYLSYSSDKIADETKENPKHDM